MENSIKVGYDSKTNIYTFKTPGGYSAKNICVNGKSITDPLRGQKIGELITITEKPETITYETTQRNLTGYNNDETHTIISVEEYNKTAEKINETKCFDDEDEVTYKTIEDEVFATRFFRNHKAVYENQTIVHNLDIEFIQYPVSEYSNIVPLYSIDATNVFETKCKYVPNNLDTFFEICTGLGVTRDRIDVPKHSGLRFVKIDGKYVSGMEEFEKTRNRTIIATYDECVERMNETRFKLKELISFHFAKQSQNVMDKSTVGHLLGQLQTLQTSVYELDVKVKDEHSQRAISNRINELIQVYKKLA
jgi:ribosomal protein S4